MGVQTTKQSYASAGKAPRRRVHSPSGIAAIAVCGLPPPRIVIGYPAHQAQSGTEPCLSFLVIECCSRRRPQLDTVRHLAGRDQAPQRYQQLARQCHDHRRLARRSAPRSACDTIALEHCLSGTPGSATPTGSAHVVPAHKGVGLDPNQVSKAGPLFMRYESRDVERAGHHVAPPSKPRQPHRVLNTRVIYSALHSARSGPVHDILTAVDIGNFPILMQHL
jgi:hypothetical protein